MNNQADEENPLVPFSPDMLLGKLPVPVPPKTRLADASLDAQWSEMELRGTLLAAHEVLAMGRPISEVAAELRYTPEYLSSAFKHLTAALSLAVADPAAPYSPLDR